MEIKVGYIVAYDYELLKNSLPTVYKGADKIVVAIDKDRKTFAGGTYTIDPGFFTWLKEVDPQKKITVYEDNFYVPGLTANEADTRERNMLAKKMGEGGWHFQIDVDEYFVNFEGLIEDLKTVESKLHGRKITLQIYCSVLFKTVSEGFFIVDGSSEQFSVATNNPVYTFHRNNGENERYLLNHLILHQSWGRTEDELRRKLENWSHHADFNTDAYFRFWQSVSLDNYKYISDFHPLFPAYWKHLRFVPKQSVADLLQTMPWQNEYAIPSRSENLKKWLPPVLYNRLLKKF